VLTGQFPDVFQLSEQILIEGGVLVKHKAFNKLWLVCFLRDSLLFAIS
jgi:hypothetical protein